MNYKMIARIISFLLCIEAAFMIPAVGIAIYDQSIVTTSAFLRTIIIILIVSLILWLVSRNAKTGFYAREGLVTTGLSWIVMSMLGCLPFYISGEIPSYIDCLFEIVSGFTTTGSSILTNVEALSRSLLYWRSFTHWVGGMGVLVFLMAVVPLSGKNDGFTLHILRAESPGPSVGKLVPRMKKTASILYWIYLGLSVINLVFLLIGGMPLFDAICTMFGTAGTGGFGIKLDSMASYSPYLQNVTTVFMFLFGVNFSCYYLLLMRRFKDVFHDEELRYYILIVLSSIILIAINIRSMYPTLEETIRHAAFQVSTIISTTGFATTDFNLWPAFSKAILLFLMLLGACAGSTGGGFKVSRLVLLFKSLRRNIHENLHPNEVRKIRVNGVNVDEKIIKTLNGYLMAYVLIIIVSYLIVSLDGFDVETNLSAIFATFNNIGPGLGACGPSASFAGFSPLSKLVMTGDMLAGRLEIFPILVLFSKSTWKRK